MPFARKRFGPRRKREDQPNRQERWRVLLQNDDYTPAEYVVVNLREVFRLGWWKARSRR